MTDIHDIVRKSAARHKGEAFPEEVPAEEVAAEAAVRVSQMMWPERGLEVIRERLRQSIVKEAADG